MVEVLWLGTLLKQTITWLLTCFEYSWEFSEEYEEFGAHQGWKYGYFTICCQSHEKIALIFTKESKNGDSSLDT